MWGNTNYYYFVSIIIIIIVIIITTTTTTETTLNVARREYPNQVIYPIFIGKVVGALSYSTSPFQLEYSLNRCPFFNSF